MEVKFKKKTDKAQKYMIRNDLENFFRSQRITKLVKISDDEKWLFFAPALSAKEESLVVRLLNSKYLKLIEEIIEYQEAA